MQPNRIFCIFWKLIGEDEQILRLCNKSTRHYLVFSGFIFFLFFLLSIYSFHYVFNGIFEIPLLSWPIAIVWSLIVFNIYRLNLSTLSADKPAYSLGYFMSLVIRLLFMVLIGMTFIKPLEIKIFEALLTPELNKFRAIKIKDNQAKITSYFDKEINVVREELKYLGKQIQENRIILGKDQILLLETKKNSLIQEKKTILLKTKNVFHASNFFFNGILIFNKKYPLVWLLSFILLFLFLLPLVLKFAMAPNSEYVKQRFQLQHLMILEDYDQFKLRYPKSFKDFPSDIITWEEKYEDPPFNTTRKVIENKYGNEKDFLNHIYGV
jgi:hypothetical protein